ncbi:MAG: hypothetical protein HYR88_17290 [Verrucomicrobia bacterium]|nr:hypothetical protein [Verrucomicrobiota bacterium]MBI3870850.1 hypothetical protein [Verrucomicrobiota bacterium]
MSRRVFTPIRLRFVLEDFALSTPGQQLLDRFVLGYPVDSGGIHKSDAVSVGACVVSGGIPEPLRAGRLKAGLTLFPTWEETVNEAMAVVVVPRGQGAEPNAPLVRKVLDRLPRGARCFVHGLLASTGDEAEALAQIAAQRGVELRSGTSVAATWRLPALAPPAGRVLKQGLAVVQGTAPWAEMNALEGLAPWTELRRAADLSVRTVRRLEGDEVWRHLDAEPAMAELLAAALSRTDSPLGGALHDGRTEDLMAPGRARQLAKTPRAWIVEDADGFRSTLMVLNGVVGDFNVAVRDSSDQVWSAQIFRPLPPLEHHYNRLAEAIESFLVNGACWSLRRSIRIAALVERMK